MCMKEDLLLKIAQKGYAVGFAANLNFATYDIVKTLPGRIAFLSIVIGIFGLVWPVFTTQCVSVGILILGISSIYIERFALDIDSYAERGKKNTEQLYKLKNLYIEVKGMDNYSDFQLIEERYITIEKEFNDGSQPNQIIFSNWYAHFKFFCEKDISWMNEVLHFEFWKDKIPQTAKILLFILLIALVVYYCVSVPTLNQFFKDILYFD